MVTFNPERHTNIFSSRRHQAPNDNPYPLKIR